jgi:archaemetzincin
MKRSITFVLLLFASIASAQQPQRVRARVHLVVLRSFPEEWIAPVSRALEEHLQVQVIREPEVVPLPRSAYYPPRRRYRAERLTEFLTARYAALPPEDRVIGLTAVDISTTKGEIVDWGILGLGDQGGRAAVISSFRMRRRARNPEHAIWRMWTTAVHEMGHVLGLPHCTEPRCIMRDAEGTMDTVDAGDGRMGAACMAEIDRIAPRVVTPR